MNKHHDYVRETADRLILQLKKGTTPWQKPWTGSTTAFPINAVTKKPYRGMNVVNLMSYGYSDPRWMTYKQAENLSAQVRKGEKSQAIEFWQFDEEVAMKDAQGRPLYDEKGSIKKQKVVLAQPRVFFARVFHASQIDNLPEYEAEPLTWDPIERADNLLKISGAHLYHSQADRAFYSFKEDCIHLPNKSNFADATRYYATILHELGHWTGHVSRLNRDLAHPFGSQGYAKEELRAEIASLMLASTLGIPHDSEQHAAYVGSWVRILEETPLEIFRACSDAQKIQDFILGFERAQEQTSTVVQPLNATTIVEKIEKKKWLNVPYLERHEAKACGAKWDWEEKSWYAPAGTDISSLHKWLPENQSKESSQLTFELDPRAEFSEVLRAMGVTVNEPHPIMDGTSHRISVIGDKNGQKSGFYVVYPDNRPAGYFQNHRTGEERRWRSQSEYLSPQDEVKLRKEVEQKQQARQEEIEQLHTQTAELLTHKFSQHPPLTTATSYHTKKGIAIQKGIFAEHDKTIIPLYDIDNTLWSAQIIHENGQKQFVKDSRKTACFHVVGGQEKLSTLPAIVLCEGYSTACSLTEALDFSAISVTSAHNLKAVACLMRDKYPHKPIVIAGDDDKHLEKKKPFINVGKVRAEEAAAAVEGVACFPMFDEIGERKENLTDFNDFVQSIPQGKALVTDQIKAAVTVQQQEIKALQVTRQSVNEPARKNKYLENEGR